MFLTHILISLSLEHDQITGTTLSSAVSTLSKFTGYFRALISFGRAVFSLYHMDSSPITNTLVAIRYVVVFVIYRYAVLRGLIPCAATGASAHARTQQLIKAQ